MESISKTLFIRKKIVGQNSIEELAKTLAQSVQGLNIKIFPDSNRSIKGIFRNIRFSIRNQGNINHLFEPTEYYILPFLRGKKIVTWHDTGTMLQSTSFLRKYIRKYIIIGILQHYMLKFADIIVCISDYTKQELIKYHPHLTNKIVVIHNGYNPLFEYVPRTFNINKPTILHIGTGKRKNLMRVICALKDISCTLWIVGKMTEEHKSALEECRIDYKNWYDMNLNDIIGLYRNCDIVSFPSLYEGFGMPIIEANAMGRCVLTSRCASIPEIAGDAALFVNPYSETDIHDGFVTLIFDEARRNSLIKSGLQNAKRFATSRMINAYEQIYRT